MRMWALRAHALKSQAVAHKRATWPNITPAHIAPEKFRLLIAGVILTFCKMPKYFLTKITNRHILLTQLAILLKEGGKVDCTELAAELLHITFFFRKANLQKKVIGAMQGEMLILQLIDQHDADILPSEICNEMEISSARVAAVLNSLENKGLITRQIDTSDRRRILVRLTQEGKATTEKHRQAVFNDIAKILSLLGEHDAKEYVRITRRLAELLPSLNDKKQAAAHGGRNQEI